MKYALVFSLLLPITAFGLKDEDSDKADALARAVVEKLFKAGQDRDVDGLMKLIDVPWCHDAREIIKDKKKLQEYFKETFEKKEPIKGKINIRKIATLEKLREQKKGPPARKVSLGEVLGENDRVVYVEIDRPDGKGFQPVWIGVRFVKGKAMIVGMVD